jgi:transketolase
MDIAALRAKHPDHWRMACAIRALTLDAVAAAKSGHSGMPIGMADVATVLFSNHLTYDAAAPDWFDRDRFVLSAGHGSMLLYALLHLTGYADMTMDQIRAFRQWGSATPGHPEYGHAKGVETTTGPLGQGLANAVGMALAEESLRGRLGNKVVNHRTWVIAGDGCLMEGISQEAITLAGRHQLGRLVVLWDNNGITIDGEVALADATDQKARFAASGWHVLEVDGHDPEAIDKTLSRAGRGKKPTLVCCKTHIALGTAAQDTAKGHGAITDAAVVAAAKETWGWTHAPYEIPDDIRAAWATAGARGRAAREAWEARWAEMPEQRREGLRRWLACETPKRLGSLVRELKTAALEERPKIATRVASERVLAAVNPVMPENFGGSADLTGSNNTRTPDLGVFSPEDRKGRYMHWGIREHGMAAAMNGMALHGGIRAYGGTFLCFTDYARPAMRLSALMGLPVVYVMTHDSIGLGEDGPTHQPVEHLAISRATPDTLVIRPADLIETAEAWEIALSQTRRPTVMALSRQNLPTVRTEPSGTNQVARGAYVLAEAEGPRKVVLIATGSEVEIALQARAALQAEGIGTRVVSMPCMELFAEQDEAYRRRVLPAGGVRIGIEAGVRQGWDRWLLGERARAGGSDFVGMASFGASAPYDRLYREFGITAEAVAERARALLPAEAPATA